MASLSPDHTINVSATALLAGMSAPGLRATLSQPPQAVANWIRAAAAEGMAVAQVCYGRMLLEGTGVEKDRAAALEWFGRAAGRGDLDAVNMAGRCFENGWGTPQDPAIAARHYQLAARGGHAWAQYNLGHLYLSGRGLLRNAPAAIAWYLRAAEQGHARAMNLVARCCEQGWGTPRNQVAAGHWYQRSAQGDYFRGQYNWATWLLEADRPDEAAVWFERAAVTGTPAVRQAVLNRLTAAPSHPALTNLAVRLSAASSSADPCLA